MLKNITFTADEKVIETARRKALNNKTTLNILFNKWINSLIKNRYLSSELDLFISKVSYASSGRSFSREELNER
ncbi:MAG: antitoxin [Actinobacteria bacterium]|nr:antitoxin [Actinomycetota bacterium]